MQEETAIYETKVGDIPVTLVKKREWRKGRYVEYGHQFPGIRISFVWMRDSMLQKNSLYEIAKPILEDDRVIACGGQICVSNGVKLSKRSGE